MLTQSEVDALLPMPKVLTKTSRIEFPGPRDDRQMEAKSEDGRKIFMLDVNRKGGKRIKLTKCTYQKRYAGVEILLRMDIDGPPHDNPDGVTVPCPHLHIYREGFADAWAYPLPTDFTDPTNLATSLGEFLTYCKVINIPIIVPWLAGL